MQRLAVLVASIIALAPAAARADSLWQRANPYSAYLFVDSRARHVGDLLTIVVRENTDINYQDERNVNKQTQTSGIFSLKASSSGNSSSRAAAADFEPSLSATRAMDGKSAYTSDHSFLDYMTVTVVAVQPNGNLVVEGMRQRIVTGERRTLHVTGVVRPIDIGPANTVESHFIANFEVMYEGKGEVSSSVNHNWLGRIMNRVWPF